MEGLCLKEEDEMDGGTFTNEIENEEDLHESFSNFAGVQLIYFEHSYSRNYAALCEINGNTSPESKKKECTFQNSETHMPVRKTRQYSKSDNLLLSVVNNTKNDDNFCIEEKMKNVPVSSSNICRMNIKNHIKVKKSEKIASEITPKNIDSPKFSPSKILQKSKLSETEDFRNEDLNSKETGKVMSCDHKKKGITIPIEGKRKRTVISSNEDNAISKKVHGLDRENQRLLKRKKIDKDFNPKIQKRNLSAPSLKGEVNKKQEYSDSNIKGNKGAVLSCNSSQKETIENVKNISPEKNSSAIGKPKLKKVRRESLRLGINEDEPALFSQPDMMVKIKTDDPIKKDEKIEAEKIHQDNSIVNDICKVSESLHGLETNTEAEAEDTSKKDDSNDVNLGNLNTDENVDEVFAKENKTSKTDEDLSNCHAEDPGFVASSDKEDGSKPTEEDLDSDKPISIRKPRRIIKKKEFFEDIATRSSTKAKSSVEKQNSDGEKKSSCESSKKDKKSMDESEDSSEDDPTKLWCICRQPHNDRFMIQCDKCEDWFHGSCVGISRHEGRKLEKQKKEWICPNCISKGSKASDLSENKLDLKKVKADEADVRPEQGENNLLTYKEKNSEKICKAHTKIIHEDEIQIISNSSVKSAKIDVNLSPNQLKKNCNKGKSSLKGNDSSSNVKWAFKDPMRKRQICITCQLTASVNSCYCSEKCLEQHANDCLALMREEKGALKNLEFDSQKIVVLDRIKGNVIAGDNAPMAGNIVEWLKENPTFMIACAGSSKHTTPKKDIDSSSSKDKKEDLDNVSKTATVRCNVQKTLKNILMDRCKNAGDIHLPEDEVRKIAVKIEEELHALFKDNSFKYRVKYRSLMFNIKDPRNQGLFRKILKGDIPPEKLVRMLPEELASLELAKWREQENQHLLDMIKRVQLEQQSGSGLHLKKTHKGEVEIEDDFNVIDEIPKTTEKLFSGDAVDIEKVEPDKIVIMKDTTNHHRSHLFDLNCKICTGKMLPPPAEDSTQKRIRVAHSISVDLSSPATLDPVEKSVSRIVDGKSPLSSTGEDSMDQEPTSTVSIGSPDAISRFISESNFGKVASSVWKGFICMQDVAKFVTSAYKVSGQTDYLNMDVPDTIQVCGRIIPDQVWDYLGKIKQSGNKELIIIRFQAANEEEAITYNTFYCYLNSRKRYGVVSRYCKQIKDFYILPLAATSPVPIVLMPFDGPGLPSPRPHLLLGVIVRHKVQQSGISIAKKERCKDNIEKLDGSYTPPLEPRSYTPPLPNIQTDKLESMSPDTLYSPPSELRSNISSVDSDTTQNVSEFYEPSYTPPLQIMPSESEKEEDEDKPYDPEQDILNIETKNSILSSPKTNNEKVGGSENLEKQKKIIDALTKQVEETDRQVIALKQLMSDDSDIEFQYPSTQVLDISSVTATGMSSFLDVPQSINLQDILNVVREKSLDKDKLSTNKGDVDMRINTLFNKSFSNSYQSVNESDISSDPQEKCSSRGATPPLEDNEENSPTLMRPSDPRIKIRTNFQELPSSEDSVNISLSTMSVTELVERAEKQLADMEATEKAQSVSQNMQNLEQQNTDKVSSTSWNQYKEPPPPGIEPADLPAEDNVYSSKNILPTPVSDNSMVTTFSPQVAQDAQQIGSSFPPPFPPPLPPGFQIQTPPPNIKNFPPPPNIITSFPPPPLPLATKTNDINPVDTWPGWNNPPQQQSKDNWSSTNRVPQWDESWKTRTESAEGSSHYYSQTSHDFHKEQFYRGESSTGNRWNRPRFERWHKRPIRGGRWRGKRSFHFTNNERN